MKPILSRPDTDHLVIAQRRPFARIFGFLLLFLGLIWTVAELLFSVAEIQAPGILLILFGVAIVLSSPDLKVMFSRTTGMFTLSKKRIPSFLSTSLEVPFEQVLVPEMTFSRGRAGNHQATLTLLLQNGSHIPLHATGSVPWDHLRTLHDAVWNFLELSPDEDPPNPFLDQGGVFG